MYFHKNSFKQDVYLSKGDEYQESVTLSRSAGYNKNQWDFQELKHKKKNLKKSKHTKEERKQCTNALNTE